MAMASSRGSGSRKTSTQTADNRGLQDQVVYFMDVMAVAIVVESVERVKWMSAPIFPRFHAVHMSNAKTSLVFI